MTYSRSVGVGAAPAPSIQGPAPVEAGAQGATYVREVPGVLARTPQPANLAERVDIRDLLERKLANPKLPLSAEQSIALMTECIRMGDVQASKAHAKDLVVFIGNTGAGKSTFVNYLCGCQMKRTNFKSLGLTGLGKVVVVVPRRDGGALDEIMPIGHTKTSMTFMPQIESDGEGMTHCDCPGFLDNRGPEINIANAVNIKKAFIRARSVKVVMLINYHSLKADRGRGLKDMIEICCDLFGNRETLIRYKDSILLGITQISTIGPDDEVQAMQDLKDFICKPPLSDPFSQATLDCLAERIFIYDPVNHPHLEFSGAVGRDDILTRIQGLLPITEPVNIFKTVLTPDDYRGLEQICDQIRAKIDQLLGTPNPTIEDFRLTAAYLDSLRQLEIIEHPYVIRLLGATKNVVIQFFRKMKEDFDQSCAEAGQILSERSEKILGALREGVQHFDEEIAKGVDLQELEGRYALYKKKVAAREYVNSFREKERKFYQFCQDNNFVGAQQLLEGLTQEMKAFADEFGETGVAPEVDLNKLRDFYASSKASYDEWVRRDAVANEKTAQLQKMVTEMAEQNKQSHEQHQQQMEALRQQTSRLQQQLEREVEEAKKAKAAAEKEREKANKKLEAEREKKRRTDASPVDRPLFPPFNPMGRPPFIPTPFGPAVPTPLGPAVQTAPGVWQPLPPGMY